MNLTTLRKLVFEKNVLAFLRMSSRTQDIYRCAFATSAGSSGVLELLARRPRGVDEIAQALQLGADKRTALEAWLECGVKAGELALGHDGLYRLKGRLSRLLAAPDNGAGASMFEEVARYHYDAILQAPRRMRGNQAYTLADQDGELIARSSRILEPFVEEAIDWAFSAEVPQSVLEVGCGAGHYLRYMAGQAPALSATALELQPSVVELARANLRQWGLLGQVRLVHGDVLGFDAAGTFDLVTLHNNIYYFSAARRAELLAHVRRQLRPRGRLLLTTSCRGGSPAIAALHLWWSLSDVAAGLPQRDALRRELLDAGFREARVRQLLPGESYYAFLATA